MEVTAVNITFTNITIIPHRMNVTVIFVSSYGSTFGSVGDLVSLSIGLNTDCSKSCHVKAHEFQSCA